MDNKLEQLINGKKKIPRCVAVYDKLFEMIQKGDFPKDTRLPSEPELAKQMGVSRMTLRQAISLLREDGIVKNIHGKGNFIISSDSKWEKGLEKLEHPIYSSIDIDIDKVEIEFRIETPTDYSNKVLERKTTAILFVDRWYKNSGHAIAYTLSIIPIETIMDKKIDLSDKNNLLEYIEKIVYDEAKHSSLEINFSESGNFSSMKYIISRDEKFYLLGEAIYTENSYPALYNKHYIPLQYGRIFIDRKK